MTKIIKDKGLTSHILIIAIGVFIAIFMGIFAAYFGSTVGPNIGIMLAVPVAMMFGFIFFFDRELLFYLIILSRASLDVLLDSTRFGSFGLGAVLNALVIFMAILAFIKHPIPVRKVFGQTWLWFLVITLISVFIAQEKLIAIKSFLVLLSFASVFILAIVAIKDEKDYGRWIRAILISSIIPIFYGFIDLANGGFHGQESEGLRVSSTFSHPNVFAFYLVLIISLSFYCYKTKNVTMPKYIQRALPFYILIMLGLLVMTKTRSGWAACFIFFTMYSILYERKYFFYLLIVPVIGFMIPEVRDRFLELSHGNEVVNYSKLNSYAWRKLLWSDGFNYMLPSHYFFGYGLESFKQLSVDFFRMSGGREYHAAHSVYVQLFFETGFVGLIAYIWLHIKMVSLLVSYYKSNKLMIFTIIMFLLEFSFEAYSDNMLTYLSYTWYLWLAIGATYAVNNAQKIESTSI